MTLGQLRTFLAVARHGSVRAAAAALFVTEPSVSAAVGALEKELQLELFARRGRGIEPTPAGAALAEYAARALGTIEQGLDAARAAGSAGVGRLRLAAVTTAGEAVVPALLREFRRRHPNVDPELEVGNRAVTTRLLTEHQADLAIAGRPPAERGITGEAILPNKIVLVASADHALAKAKLATTESLAAATWLLREEGSGTRATVEEFFIRQQIEPRSRLTIGSNGAVRQAAILGLGITLIPERTAERELESGLLRIVRARGLPIERAWHVWFVEHAPLPPVAALFLEFLRSPAARRAARTT